MDRYARQTLLPEVGEAGQQRLSKARVLVVGAGGLGCPSLQYLAGSGIGSLRIVDADTVAEHNLHRQPLYGAPDIGAPKVAAAARRLGELNPEVNIDARRCSLNPATVDKLLDGIDVALDCADSFAVTYILSDNCFARGVPLLSASALALGGYAGGFCGGAPSVRAIFPDLPDQLASCDTAGVLGPVVGMLGALQAQMTLATLLGLQPSPLGQMVSLDARGYRFSGFRFDAAPEPDTAGFPFIAAADVTSDDLVIELRPRSEAPVPAVPNAIRMEMGELENGALTPQPGRRTVLCCRTGLRAWRAARMLSGHANADFALLAAGERTDE